MSAVHRLSPALVSLLVAALVASACGGGGEGATSTTVGEVAPSTASVEGASPPSTTDQPGAARPTTTVAPVEAPVEVPADLGPCAEPAPDDLGAGMLCADSGFRLLDGFAFPNWAGSVYEGDGFGADELVSLYGAEQVCAEYDGEQCVLNGGAAQRLAELDALVQGGRCEGMAVLGARFHAGLADRTLFRADATITAQLPPTAPQLIGVIHHWWATQFSEATISATAASRDLGPAALLRRLVADLPSGATSTLGIYSGTSGHALLPVAVTLRDDGIHEVHVYDGNVVGKLRILEIDEDADQWRYAHAATSADVEAEEWSGGAGTIDLTPMSSREGALTCDSCGGEVVRGSAPIRVTMLPVRGSAIRLAVADADGDVVEVAAGGIDVGIEGAMVQVHRDGPGQGVTVLLPPDVGDLVVDAEVMPVVPTATEAEPPSDGSGDGGIGDGVVVEAPAAAMVSVVRPDASAVQVEVVATVPDDEAPEDAIPAGVRITTEARTDAMTVEVGAEAEARASMASERQTMTVALKAEQVMEAERPAVWTEEAATVEVVVTEADEVVFAETIVEDVDEVVVVEMAVAEDGSLTMEEKVRDAEDVAVAEVLSSMVDKAESKPVDPSTDEVAASEADATDPESESASEPAGEMAAEAEADEVGLTWKPATGAVDHYAVEVRQADGSWKVVQMVDEKTTGATFGGVPEGTWDVRVVTVFRDGTVIPSVPRAIDVDGKPQTPSTTTTTTTTTTTLPPTTTTVPVATTTDPPGKAPDDGKGDDGKGDDGESDDGKGDDGKQVVTTTVPVATTTDPPGKALDDGKGDDGKGDDGESDDGKGDDGKPVVTTTVSVATTTDPPGKAPDDGKGDDGKPDDGEGDDGKGDDGKPVPSPTTTAAPPPTTAAPVVDDDDGKGDDGKSDDGKGDDAKPAAPPPPTTTAAPPPPTTTAAPPPPPTTTAAPPPPTTTAAPKPAPTTTAAPPTTTAAPAQDGKDDDGKDDAEDDGKDDGK